MFRFLRIHTVPAEDEGSTWLQLFFDLVYVAILIELGNRLSHDLTLEGALEFALLFIPIWWSWLEFVFYGRHFPVDDIGQRILTVLYIAFMVVMAFEIHDVTAGAASAFLVGYGLLATVHFKKGDSQSNLLYWLSLNTKPKQRGKNDYHQPISYMFSSNSAVASTGKYHQSAEYVLATNRPFHGSMCASKSYRSEDTWPEPEIE
jgi:hypothetical protein